MCKGSYKSKKYEATLWMIENNKDCNKEAPIKITHYLEIDMSTSVSIVVRNWQNTTVKYINLTRCLGEKLVGEGGAKGTP